MFYVPTWLRQDLVSSNSRVECNTSLYIVLCQNINKSVNNSKNKVGLDDNERMNKTMNNIVLSFTIKKITIK